MTEYIGRRAYVPYLREFFYIWHVDPDPELAPEERCWIDKFEMREMPVERPADPQ